MTSVADEVVAPSNRARTCSGHDEPLWYAVQTSANHERRIAAQLLQRKIEHFLPLYLSVRRWKDRTVRLHLPLFPGYIFVRFALCDRLRVLQVQSVVRLVGFGGAPSAIAVEEVESLRSALAGGVPVEPHPFLKAGRRVQITSGPFAGRQGILKRWKGDFRVLLSMDLIQRAMLVEVEASSIIPVKSRHVEDQMFDCDICTVR